MARVSLATRAERVTKLLAGRDVNNLPKYVDADVTRLAKQMGVSRERLVSYAPSTRTRYLRAARAGRTVEQERARVRAQRAAKRSASRKTPPRDVTQRSLELARELRNVWGLDTKRGPGTMVDRIAAEELLSPESIRQHIKYYGPDYVEDHLQQMIRAVTYATAGPSAWRRFSADSERFDDERWFWYHTSPRMMR